MIAVILLGIAAFLVLAGGLAAFIIMLVKKVKWWGSCLVLVGVLGLTGLLVSAAVGFWVYEKSGDKIDSAKDFFGELEDFQEEAEEAMKEAEKVSDELDKVNTNTSTNTNTSSDKSESTTKDADYYKDQGMIENTDYSFLITVGEDKAKKITQKETVPLEGVTAAYLYCHQTTDNSYGSSECPTGTVEIFRISVYTVSQWNEVKDSPFAGTSMGQDGGYYFIFSHPNGLMPSDVSISGEFYSGVITSIDFAD
ncbi:MAG: hypothetical protein HQ530_00420 [Parcubacteria group bacterium]|nr:hypothetical protein [Parcubacteria group bacterium]